MSKKHSLESFSSLSDESLVLIAQQGNNSAFDFLCEKYRVVVRNKSLSYFIAGAGRDDIIQEGMIGLFKAVRDFSAERGVSFRTFADVCVTRQILTAVKNASRHKHAPLNTYVSLNKTVSEDKDGDATLLEYIGGSDNANPEQIVLNKEKASSLGEKMNEALSDFELLVLSYYLQGYDYVSIGKKIEKDSKSIDNALQRIKKKMEKISAAYD